MADVTIGAKLSVDASQATTSVKNFKQELNLANQQVVEMASKFGVASKEAQAAAKRAAELKDAIGDAKSLVDAFNPDTKFRAFGAAINTVVGGFTALTGVLGLVGVESEEVQKALLKVQSALALSQGLSQLQEGIQAFKNLGAVIGVTTVIQRINTAANVAATAVMRALGISVQGTGVAFNVLKGIIISTGIGALIIGITLLVQKISEWTDKTNDQTEAQKALKKSIEDLEGSFNRQLDFLDKRAKLERLNAQLAGATEEELAALDEKALRRRIKTAESTLKDAELQGKNLADFKGKLADEQFKLDEFILNRQIKQQEDAAKRLKEQQEKAAKERVEAVRRATEEANRQASNFTATGGPGGGLNIEIPKSPAQLQLEQEAQARNELRLVTEAIQARLAENDAKFTEIHKRNVDERIAAEKLEFENKQMLAGATADILGSLTQLVGQQTAAGKVFAIAQALINTYTAVTAVLRAAGSTPAGGIPGYAIAQAVAVGVAGLANVKKIIEVKTPGSSGGSVPNLSTNAPLTPQRPERQSTTLDQNSLNALNNAAVRTYVVESDIENNRERIVRLNRAARLGG